MVRIVEQIHPFGVAVDLDLSTGLRAEDIPALHALFDAHGLLLFRDQALSYDQQAEIGGLFGPVIHEKVPNILDPNGGLGTKELAFHSDLACDEEPIDAISLHALDVDDGQATRFVNAITAAERLPAALAARLRDLSALHLWPTVASSSARDRGSPATPKDWPGAVHPVLMKHPRNGREILYLSEGQTERIIDLPFDEGEALIRAAFDVLYDEGCIMDHQWRTGDLLVWDNLVFQHGRRPLRPGTRRKLRRITMGSYNYARHAPAEFRAAFADLAED